MFGTKSKSWEIFKNLSPFPGGDSTGIITSRRISNFSTIFCSRIYAHFYMFRSVPLRWSWSEMDVLVESNRHTLAVTSDHGSSAMFDIRWLTRTRDVSRSFYLPLRTYLYSVWRVCMFEYFTRNMEKAAANDTPVGRCFTQKLCIEYCLNSFIVWQKLLLYIVVYVCLVQYRVSWHSLLASPYDATYGCMANRRLVRVTASKSRIFINGFPFSAQSVHAHTHSQRQYTQSRPNGVSSFTPSPSP